MRAGVNHATAVKIADKVRSESHPISTTLEVYKRILRELATQDDVALKHRYRLKESLMLLGPSGYHFESFMAKVFSEYGYKVHGTGQLHQGKCVRHEIDIVARDSNQKMVLIECKYHNFRGIFTKLKESLYTHARFMDLREVFDSEMLVCNTKISNDAKTYAKCIGQKLLAWKYPQEEGLEKIIQEKGLYPITILPLKSRELEEFSKNNLILVKDLLERNITALATKTNIPIARLQRLRNLASKVIK